MVRHLLLSFSLILAINFASAQEKQEKIDSGKIAVTDSIAKKKYHDIFIGVDLFNPIIGTFKDKKGFNTFLSYQINNKWHLMAEVGYEKNIFNEINWNVDVNGFTGKIGANWFVTQDIENLSNGIYFGGRLAYTKYNQTINSYAIRDLQSNELTGETGSRPKISLDAFWVEVVLGARIEIFKGFYGEISLHPAAYLGGKKDGNINPLVIPGYGKTNGPFNLPIFWGISYKIK